MKQKDIWNAIDKLADNRNVSVSCLAKKAGLDATSFNKSKRISPVGKPRWPSMESISKLLDSLNIDFLDFASLIDNEARGQKIKEMPLERFIKEPSVVFYLDNKAKTSQVAVNPKEAFSLIIDNNDYCPFYKKDSKLIVSRKTHSKPSDRVIVKTRKNEVYIGDLLGISAMRYEIETLPDSKIVKLGFEHIKFISKIVFASQ